MNEKIRYGFGVEVNKLDKGTWSFGSGISHGAHQTYLFINFIKWNIFIGWLAKEVKNG